MKKIVLCMVTTLTWGVAAFAQGEGNKVLVAYFSATGTTERVAKMVADAVGGTLYKIEPATVYTTADLNWHDKTSRSSVEMADVKSRPELKSRPANLRDYDTVYVGFPIWWDLAPRIINTFIESGDFTGKAVIPFATSGGSGISNAAKELKQAYPGLKWQKGRLLNSVTEKDIKQWVNK